MEKHEKDELFKMRGIDLGLVRPGGRLAAFVILLVIFLGVGLLAIDSERLAEAVRQARWELIPAALAFTVVSYLFVGYSFARVSRLIGVSIGERELAEIGFTTIILNHVLTTGGIFGYSLRYLFMHRRGATLKEVVATSILHFYLTSLVILAFLPMALGYLLVNVEMSPGTVLVLGLVSLVLLVPSLLGALIIFMSPLRRAVLRIIAQATRKLVRRDIVQYLRAFDVTMDSSITSMRAQPGKIVGILVMITIDWAAAIAALGMCIAAFGAPVSPVVLLTGFVIGILAGTLSMLPGGIGVQEGSMAGVFALMGVSFERAVLAAVLFRGVYYLIPYFCSLGFYWRLMRQRA